VLVGIHEAPADVASALQHRVVIASSFRDRGPRRDLMYSGY
jgi:hypothetical protein